MYNHVSYIQDFARDNMSGEELVGAKMSNLTYLARLGLPVPCGFTVTVRAFNDFIMLPEVAKKLGALEAATDPDSQIRLAQEVRDCIVKTEMPSDMKRQIGEAYRSLCATVGLSDTPTAVRSSAIGEDAAENSFAGQYESYLGVVGVIDVCANVQMVWSSMFNDRAVKYRIENDISVADTPMAVGVLELIEAESAGVAFSVDPVSGKNDRVFIEASWGLGEAVVQGDGDPDGVYIDKEELRVMRYRCGRKRRKLVFDIREKASTWQDVSEELWGQPCLAISSSVEIAKLVIRLEDETGAAADIEWATTKAAADGSHRLVLVQYRPISAVRQASTQPIWKRSLSISDSRT